MFNPIPPLKRETEYILVTPEQVAAMSEEEIRALGNRYKRERMEDIIRDQVHKSVMAAFDGIFGGGWR
jgi:hypothetical protein